MKILITSGGTKIPIDTVRSITNMSHGTLGSRMAEECLNAGHEVFFLRAKDSKSPLSITIDLVNQDYEVGTFASWYNSRKEWWSNYKEISYKTFDDYELELKNAILTYKPDLIILAAAVSDYGVENPVEGKIRTKGDLTINLKPLPKLISNVREWAGKSCFIVGFKLLVDVSEDELLNAAWASLKKNKLNLVCANDLRTILNGNHKLWVCANEVATLYSHTKLTNIILNRVNENVI